MNRGLLAFSIFLVIAGFAINSSLLSVLGLLLLVPSFVTAPRPRKAPGPISTAPPPRRISPPPPPVSTMNLQAPPAPLQTYMPASPTPSPSSPTFSSPLFPTSMFPTLSLQAQPYPQTESAPKESSGEDDLLELGALLVLLKLVAG